MWWSYGMVKFIMIWFDLFYSYDKIIELNPNFAYSWYNKGDFLKKLKRYDEAMEWLNSKKK